MPYCAVPRGPEGSAPLHLSRGPCRFPCGKSPCRITGERDPEHSTESGWRMFRHVASIGVVYILVLPWLGYLLSVAALITATMYCQVAN